MKNQKGFTLIELMIVVAIIGILASVAVPQYQDYIARTKVTDAYSSGAATKTMMADYFSLNGKMPTTTSTATGSVEVAAMIAGVLSSEYISAATWTPDTTDTDKGELKLTMTSDISKDVVGTFLAIEFDGSGPTFTLNCKAASTSTDVPEKFLPKFCKA